MKRRIKHKEYPVSPQAEQGAADPISGIQRQLASLEKKIDALAVQLSGRSPEVKHFPRPFQSAEGSHRHGEVRQNNNNYRDRVLHKAVCADCHKECEVPFKPSQDRPVYCKECFSKRKVGTAGGAFKERHDNAPREDAPRQRHFDKDRSGGDRKFAPRGRRFDKNRPGADRKFVKNRKPSIRRRKKSD